jgi:hypothetical protein
MWTLRPATNDVAAFFRAYLRNLDRDLGRGRPTVLAAAERPRSRDS